ncbi:hypothetical protein FBY39_2942 [Microbacterium sp. SLBN-146]|nr:hypothetical protein FBY39_2942 [Microbacterium sp. SLBN-146]
MTLRSLDVTAAYPVTMDDLRTGDDERDDLLTRLDIIEAQSLAERAAAYESLHDGLARRLESMPTTART